MRCYLDQGAHKLKSDEDGLKIIFDVRNCLPNAILSKTVYFEFD